MAIIDNSYFVGDCNIPNINASDIASNVSYFTERYENEYLQKAMGYELFNNFIVALQAGDIEQKYLDILLGKEYVYNGVKKLWNGFVSVSNSQQIFISITNPQPIIFTVGVGNNNPNDGEIEYNNTLLANKIFEVEQRGFGFLEFLKDDNSNVATADIEKLTLGGFRLLKGVKFTDGDKFQVTLKQTVIDANSITSSTIKQSPIADYVFYKIINDNASQNSGIGEVKPKGQNANVVSPMERVCAAYNRMVESTKILTEFLQVNLETYPEFATHINSIELELLTTRLNPYFN